LPVGYAWLWQGLATKFGMSARSSLEDRMRGRYDGN